MNTYKCDVVVFKINKKSKRGYFFTEKAVDEYLSSQTCRLRLENKNALGVNTHFKRYSNEETKDKLPEKDVALYDMAFTHFVSRLYKKDGYLMAELTILDPTLFEGKVKERVSFILGLLKSGVKLPISAGIEAFYNPITKEGEKIYDIIGIDFTLDPDFHDGRII